MKDPSLISSLEWQSDAAEAGLPFQSYSSPKPLYILAPFVPTPQDVVDRMLALGSVTSADMVYDLGCGDGRIAITAARTYGARAFGVDLEPYRVAEANSNAKAAGVESLVTFKLQDALELDVSAATVVTLYLVEWSTLKLKPMLTSQLKQGARIVSHNYDMGEWEPARVETFTDSAGKVHSLFLWLADGIVRTEL
jgi:SAM-dependent methyltransferase